MSYRIGIDVGGTNTDAVVVSSEDAIIAKTKVPTTENISDGIEMAIKAVLTQKSISTSLIRGVMLGTTHCANALVRCSDLSRIGAIRIALPAGGAVPTMTDFPEKLESLLGKHLYMVHGGYEFDGREISSLDEKEVKTCLKRLCDDSESIEALAITGIFSRMIPDQELQVAQWARELMGESVAISCSHKIGGLGLLERENATILNAALHGIMAKMTVSLENTMEKLGLNTELHIVQNDGTLMSLEQARAFPILTIATGPTNSIRGAGKLSRIKNAVVVDVGGTTTDGGVLVNSFPRESSQAQDIGGVMTNFRMPDVFTVGLGGGTVVRFSEERCTPGPDSVGYLLTSKALAFGGTVLTLSDFFVAEDSLKIEGTQVEGDTLKEKIATAAGLSYQEASRQVRQWIQERIEILVDRLKTSAEEVPLVACGGGAFLLPSKIAGISQIFLPEHYEVANALGASIAKISSEKEVVVNTANKPEETAMEELLCETRSSIISNGAVEGSVEILMKESIPLAYLPGVIRLRVKLSGDLGPSSGSCGKK